MPTIAEIFNQALRHHQSGELALAENYYRQIVQADPRHADAWHLLGVIALQAGRHEVAVEYISQALRLRPAFPEALNNLGIALHSLGKVLEAEASYRTALCLKPDNAVAYDNLGNVLRDQGRREDAELSFRQALRLNPGLAQAYNSLGNALLDQGRHDEAEGSYREALRQRPGYVEAHTNLGNVLRVQGKLEDAEACYREALRLSPGHAEAHRNLGAVLHDQAKVVEAEGCFREALRLKPDYAEVYRNLGVALEDQDKREEAEACYREAVRLKPDHVDAHLNLGFYWLLHGNFAQGWPEYEWRRRSTDNLGDALPPPSWNGSALDGQTILLQVEQGAGDAFQFVRYARVLKAKGGHVVLQCQPALAPLLASCPAIDQVVETGTALPGSCVTAPLLSLPMLCRTTLETIPSEVPYLAVDPARVDVWRARLAALPGFKLGICWQGNPKFKKDRLRSVPIAFFAPLAAVPGVCLVALQRGPGLEQIAQQSAPLRIMDLPGRSADSAEGWLESAALIQALDLVISVDTAVVHLAGALAAPVWVALPFVPDWRWHLNREDSPWYPTMRLFRQRTPGNWPEVFQRIGVALHQVVTNRETAG